MYGYFRVEKTRVERKRIAEASKGMGRPKVGGEFELLDQWGRGWGSEGLRGGFSLVSLGEIFLWGGREGKRRGGGREMGRGGGGEVLC